MEEVFTKLRRLHKFFQIFKVIANDYRFIHSLAVSSDLFNIRLSISEITSLRRNRVQFALKLVSQALMINAPLFLRSSKGFVEEV